MLGYSSLFIFVIEFVFVLFSPYIIKGDISYFKMNYINGKSINNWRWSKYLVNEIVLFLQVRFNNFSKVHNEIIFKDYEYLYVFYTSISHFILR